MVNNLQLFSNTNTRPDIPSRFTVTEGLWGDHVWLTFYSKGATSYKIYRSTSRNKIGERIGKAWLLDWRDCTVKVSKQYYYRVKACNQWGCSDYTKQKVGWAKLYYPRKPSLRAYDGIHEDRVRISFKRDAHCKYLKSGEYFRLYRSSNSNNIGSLIYTGTAVYFDDTKVIPGKKYYYRMRECNQKGYSPMSDSNSGYAKLSKPPIPTNISAGDGTYKDKICVTNYQVQRASTYKIYRSSSANQAGNLVKTTPNPAWYDYSITSGQVYYYSVKACNNSGCSELCKSNNGFAQLLLPQKPHNIQASDGKFVNLIKISSYTVPGASHYKIYRSTLPASHGTVVVTTSETSWNDFSVSAGKKYYYRVQACIPQGCSSISSYDIGYTSSRLKSTIKRNKEE